MDALGVPPCQEPPYICMYVYIYTYILIRQYGLIKDNSGRITDIANLICLQFFTWVQGERSIIWNAGKPHVKSRHGRFCILVTDWVTLNWVMIRKNSQKIEQQNWIHQNPSESIRIHQKISVNNGGNFSVCLMVNICFWGLESWTNEVHEASSNSHSFYS